MSVDNHLGYQLIGNVTQAKRSTINHTLRSSSCRDKSYESFVYLFEQETRIKEEVFGSRRFPLE